MKDPFGEEAAGSVHEPCMLLLVGLPAALISAGVVLFMIGVLIGSASN